MGADKISNLKKCGDILIDMNKNKKTKMYTFNCAFCDINCDQLKKFSIHLEQSHFQTMTDEKVEIFEPEIKLEEPIDQTTNDLKNDINIAEPVPQAVHEDPLGTNEIANTDSTLGQLDGDDVKVKVENEVSCSLVQNSDYENNEEMDYEDCMEENSDEDDEDFKPTKKGSKKVYSSKKKKISTPDSSSDDSNEESCEIDKNKKLRKTKRQKKSELDENIDEKELIRALFEAYEKQPILWNPKQRTNDRNISEKGFETVANEVNEKLNTSISWKFAKIRINALRIEYSNQLEKQRKGEKYELPWYSELIKYLQENIDFMLRERHRKFDRRLKYLDTSLLPVLIELYKTHKDLWQVNTITFGITAKRDETFTKIIEELKMNHKIEMTTDKLQDYIKYINRLYSKDKEQQLKCELNKAEFTPVSQFFNELCFLRESQGPFKCDICNKIIQKYENYHMHVAEHNNTKPFKCPLCEMGFKTFDIYIVHAKRHLSLNSFHCNVCGKVYPFKAELDRHLIGHTGEKPFLCQICGTSFRVHRDYDNHVRRHEKRFRYECHICKHGFNHLHTLNDHVKSHLQIRDIFCDICGKGFTAARYLNNHKLIHEDKKRYKCNVCGKEFAQGAGFRAHRKQHQPHLSAAELKRKKESLLDSFNI